MNLIKADLYRISKDRTLYLLLAALAVLALAVGFMYQWLGIAGTTMGDMILNSVGAETLCSVLGVAIGLFCGRDYEQNTIRNKLCCGESRYKLFFTKLIESFLLAAAFFAVSALVGTVSGAVWFERELGEDFWAKLVCQFMIILGFAAMITAITCVSKSSKTPILVTIVCFVILNPLARFLPQMSDGPLVTGLSRGIYLITSVMLMGSENGIYSAVNNSMVNGEFVRTVIEYPSMYLNAVLLSLLYMLSSIGISLAAISRQEYK